MPRASGADPESLRLAEEAARKKNWKRWGPYLADRQWATVREDYSADGDAWDYFPHEQARSRAYRWGEDGLLGICDRECRLCFALSLWNERDPFLKERLFGLTASQGNHGEDVKECYFFVDSTPTHSYMKALYRYPQAAFPYARLVEENRRRGKQDPEFELQDAGVFDENRFFDVFAEYAKASPDDILIRITVANRGPDPAPVHLLPTLWARNTWSWGRGGDTYWPKPVIARAADGVLVADQASLGRFLLAANREAEWLFTENETNFERVFGAAAAGRFVKDAFHDCVVGGRASAVNPAPTGTKAAAHWRFESPAGGEIVVALRLVAAGDRPPEFFGPRFSETFAQRIREADQFYAARTPAGLSADETRVVRQAYAGLLWNKQFYNYVVREWLQGDPAQPPPAPARALGRNHDWTNLFNRDVISMPDSWEYPWYAAWDLAFHTVALARIDPEFAKSQLVLLLREWYMHPSGQLPAYEFSLSDVNPPVHAWACWRVYKMTGPPGGRDHFFLARVFHKLLLNFTWWVNRKDVEGKNLFAGGFLGLDNVGVFDRSQPLPGGGRLEQADGTAWMAFYCATMLSMALELAGVDPAYEDVASKFFEHFVAIADAMNTMDGTGLWDDADGFYYDHVHLDGRSIPLRLRSIVGLIPLIAVENLEDDVIARLPGFSRRMRWFLEHRADLAQRITYLEKGEPPAHMHRLLAIPSRERLLRSLELMLDEREFLSPFGVRSLSLFHRAHPFEYELGGATHRVAYSPGESDSELFGGNSNWRGPVWFPVNYLLIEALERYHHFYGDALQVEHPTGSGVVMNLEQVARDLSRRLVSLFLPDKTGRRPYEGDGRPFAAGPLWRDFVLFHEYFHADRGRGCGASHQTGWTALVARCIEDLARERSAR